MDASPLSRSSTPLPWHTDAVGGASTPSAIEAIVVPEELALYAARASGHEGRILAQMIEVVRILVAAGDGKNASAKDTAE